MSFPNVLYLFFGSFLIGNVQKLNHKFVIVLSGLHFIWGLGNRYRYHISNKFKVYCDFSLGFNESLGWLDIDDPQLGSFDLNEKPVTLKTVLNVECLLVRVSSACLVY